jgi:S-adenosylmethionine hydrolase
MLPDHWPPPIVLTTDFGAADPYAGVMKGVIHGINPRAVVIDLTHQVPPQDLRRAAFYLAASHRYFPAGTIHVAVVDPGVGTQRWVLLVTTPTARFLAPDNGILSYVLPRPGGPRQSGPGRHPVPPGCAAYQLTNPDYWLHPVSSTFHGRDIFAPVAAHLSLGVAPQALGTPVADLVWLPGLQPAREDGAILGEVLYADHFGNLITNISSQDLAGYTVTEVEISNRRIPRLSGTYHGGDAPAGELVALIGSHGYLEIARPDGSAAAALGVGAGEPVRVSVG